MAAQTETHHSFYSSKTCSSYHHLSEELSAILNHGSISFGRYAGDSIAWEKRSVFTHNRCQDELEKFRAPGLVAQKKAYFEEYYKSHRAMKTLPAHQKESSRCGPGQETKESTTGIENGIDAAVSEKEGEPSNVTQNVISDNSRTLHLTSPIQGIVNNLYPSRKEVQNCSSENNDATMKKGMDVSMNIVEAKNSFAEVFVPCSTLNGNSKCVQQNSIASSKERQTIKKPRKHGSILKDKGTLASAMNKAKVHCITTKDAMKSKPKASFHQQSTAKVNESVPSRKESISNSASNLHRQITDPFSSSPRLHMLSTRGRLVSSSSDSNLRKAEAKPTPSFQRSTTKIETKFPAQTPKIQVTRLVPSASSSSIRKTEAKSRSSTQHLGNKLATSLPVLGRKIRLRNMAHDNRNPSEWSSHHVRPRDEESVDQIPKVFRSLLSQEKSNHSIGVEQIRNYNKEQKQEEGKDKIHAGLGRNMKHASTLFSLPNKASVRKLIQKVVPITRKLNRDRTGKLNCDRGVERQKRPAWRY